MTNEFPVTEDQAKTLSRMFLTLDERSVLDVVTKRFRETGKAQTLTHTSLQPVCENLVRYGRLVKVKRGKKFGYMPRFYISPKRDFPRSYGCHGFLIDGAWVNKGFVVTDGFCNIMPGATWFRSIEDAMDGLETLIQCKFNADAFWEAWRGRFLIAQAEFFNRG